MNKALVFTIALATLVAACGDDSGSGSIDAALPDGGAVSDLGTQPDLDGGYDAGSLDAEHDADSTDAELPFEFGEDPPNTCNGSEHLCDRRLDEVAYLTTHNAYSTQEEGYIAPNQTHSMKRQLANGVRGLMLDTYDNGEFPTSLCHSSCVFGERSLADGLRDVAKFLEARPRNVVTLILESYITGAQFLEALREAGLEEHVWVPSGEDVPTLRELIDAETQLILFTNRDADAFPGYLDVWSWSWDTDWNNQKLEDFSCDRLRGSTDNPFFILNHFMSDPVANTFLAGMANADPVLRDRVEQCQTESGKMPNFVTVDFYEIGIASDVVNELNRP